MWIKKRRYTEMCNTIRMHEDQIIELRNEGERLTRERDEAVSELDHLPKRDKNGSFIRRKV